MVMTDIDSIDSIDIDDSIER